MVVKSRKVPKKKSKAKIKFKVKPRAGKAGGGGRKAGKPVAKAKSPAKAPTSVGTVARNKAKPVVPRKFSRPSFNYASELSYFARPAPKVVKRVLNRAPDRKPSSTRTPRFHQFSYMKAPGLEHEFEVGDSVEVFCDHEKNRERIRGWVKGIVVQVDNKLVAVQFRSNVFLTDGWMVPDRILWYPVNSEHIRPVPGKKPARKELIPEY